MNCDSCFLKPCDPGIWCNSYSFISPISVQATTAWWNWAISLHLVLGREHSIIALWLITLQPPSFPRYWTSIKSMPHRFLFHPTSTCKPGSSLVPHGMMSRVISRIKLRTLLGSKLAPSRKGSGWSFACCGPSIITDILNFQIPAQTLLRTSSHWWAVKILSCNYRRPASALGPYQFVGMALILAASSMAKGIAQGAPCPRFWKCDKFRNVQILKGHVCVEERRPSSTKKAKLQSNILCTTAWNLLMSE